MKERWVILIIKNKGKVQDYGNYKMIKLMYHIMKMRKRIEECQLWDTTSIGENQLGIIIVSSSTVEPIFILRQVVEKYEDGQRRS